MFYQFSNRTVHSIIGIRIYLLFFSSDFLIEQRELFLRQKKTNNKRFLNVGISFIVFRFDFLIKLIWYSTEKKNLIVKCSNTFRKQLYTIRIYPSSETDAARMT